MSISSVQSAQQVPQYDVDVVDRKSLTVAIHQLRSGIKERDQRYLYKIFAASVFMALSGVVAVTLTKVSVLAAGLVYAAGVALCFSTITKSTKWSKAEKIITSILDQMSDRLSSVEEISKFANYVLSKKKTTKIDLFTFFMNFASFNNEHPCKKFQ
jgi:hypothetical protein